MWLRNDTSYCLTACCEEVDSNGGEFCLPAQTPRKAALSFLVSRKENLWRNTHWAIREGTSRPHWTRRNPGDFTPTKRDVVIAKRGRTYFYLCSRAIHTNRTNKNADGPRRPSDTRRGHVVSLPPQVIRSPKRTTCSRLPLFQRPAIGDCGQSPTTGMSYRTALAPSVSAFIWSETHGTQSPSALSSSPLRWSCHIRSRMEFLEPSSAASPITSQNGHLQWSGTTRTGERAPTALQRHRPAPTGFYLGHTPSLQRFKHPSDRLGHRLPFRRLQTFPR
jgi:hypothetical protein